MVSDDQNVQAVDYRRGSTQLDQVPQCSILLDACNHASEGREIKSLLLLLLYLGIDILVMENFVLKLW